MNTKHSKTPWYPQGPLSEEESNTQGGISANICISQLSEDPTPIYDTTTIAYFENEKDRDLAISAVNSYSLYKELLSAVNKKINDWDRGSAADHSGCSEKLFIEELRIIIDKIKIHEWDMEMYKQYER